MPEPHSLHYTLKQTLVVTIPQPEALAPKRLRATVASPGVDRLA